MLMSDSTLDYVVQSYGYLLECTLATYEGLCLKKSSSKSEIRRHEEIIKNSFRGMYTDLAMQASSFKLYSTKWQFCTRVREVLGFIAAEGLDQGVGRYILKHSYLK